jgi:hypothetical protein
MDFVLLIIQATIAVVSVLISIYATRSSAVSAQSAEHSATLQRGTHNLAAFREFLVHEYLEREFTATESPIINGTKITQLHLAKVAAMREYKRNPTEWDIASVISNQGSWQNKVAYEIAWALESVGVAAFTGALPIQMTLAIAGDTFIDDWLLCRSWVKSYRESEQVIQRGENTHATAVPYHRRHAEWLVLITAAWMMRNWAYPNCEHVVEWYGGKQHIPAQIQSYSLADGLLMTPTVIRDIRELTGTDVKK